MRGTLATGLRYLGRNARRTALTVLGIALSVSLVCGTALIADSIRGEGLRFARQRYGSFYAEYAGLSETQLAILRSHAGVGRMGVRLHAGVQGLGAAGTLAVEGMDAGYMSLSNLALETGAWPSRAGEVAVERWALAHLGDRAAALGGEVRLRIVAGDRGSAPAERTARLVGVIGNRAGSQEAGVAVAVTLVDDAREIGGATAPLYDVAFTTAPRLPIQQTIEQIRASLDVPAVQVRQNGGLLTAMAQSRNDSANRAVAWLEMILTVVVLVSTAGIIYNSFAISVTERTREFGLLRAAGATPGQIRGVVFAEAGLLSIAGVPVGIGAGVAAVGALFRFFGSHSTVGLSSMRIAVTPRAVAFAASAGLAAVLLSALFPAAAAGATSPLAAMSAGAQRESRRPGRGVVTRLLGFVSVEASLAWLNTRRNTPRFLVTVFSMSIGVTLFVAFSFFARLMGLAMDNYRANRLERDLAVYLQPYDPSSELTPEEVREIRGRSFAAEVLVLRYGYASVRVPEARLTPSFRDTVASGRAPAGTILRGAESTVAIDLFGLGEPEMALCRSGILRGSPGPTGLAEGVLLWPASFEGASTPKALLLEPGEQISVVTSTGAVLTVPVVGIVDQPPSARTLRAGAPALLVSDVLFREIVGRDGVAAAEIGLARGADRDQALRELEQIAGRKPGRRAVDTRAQYRAQQDVMTQLGVLFFGLVAVVGLIGAVSIVNTVSTNLILRTRELGSIRACGMTPGQMLLMVALEGVFTALLAAIGGGLVGTGVARVLFSQVNSLQRVPWMVPWGSIGLAAGGAILIGAVAALLPCRRMARLSVVEAIRGTE